MGKKRMAMLGSEDEAQIKAKTDIKREQKKLRGGLSAARLPAGQGRQGKTAKTPGLGGGQRVVDTTEESLREYEVIQQKVAEVQSDKVTGIAKKPRAAKIRSKKYQVVRAKVNPEQKYSLPDTIKLLRDISYSKTNTTVELHITLREKGFSSTVDLPHSTGKTKKVAIVDEATLAKIAAGKIDFDVLLASPADMPALIKYAKVLGPRGLMPNPKSGTVVADPKSAKVKFESATSVDLKPDKDGLAIHLVVGKLTQSDNELVANISAVLKSLSQVSKVILKSTMSPGIKLQV